MNLTNLKKENLNEFDYEFDVYMPWNRLFGVGIEVKK
ncbi:hypothetical protein O163_00050 [Caldanaerobacter subterraneus subsp. yonseiensis KB-1]|uniref:Uncharacterized protein n=1 Tax=Caldanaerobacter subterraneus subsp. yonseiensis KB-1 TaxID=1388761 RepID=U5CUG0_CALSX|nr:hypothetical protein O163_00050 [Caldanaerobacter subterraneus subsp. yonseiensis KB-1]